MNGPVEERLRRALAQQAETTTTSPDGWRRIQARRAGARRPGFDWWKLLAPAAAVTAVIVVLALVAGGGGERTLRVTGDSDALRLLPTGVEPRFRLVNVTTTHPGGPSGPVTYRAFGRRGPDGVALQASVVITIPGDLARGATPDLAPMRVLDQEVIAGTNPVGQRALRWYQPDGREVGLLTYGLSSAEVVRVVESLVLGDASTDTPALPAGLAPFATGSLPGDTQQLAVQDWDSDDGARFLVTVAEESGASLDRVALSMPGGRALNLRGTTAIYSPAGGGYLTWLERPETVVSLQGQGLSEKELVTIAQGLRPVPDAEWQALEARFRPPAVPAPPPDIGPPPGGVVHPNAWFGIVAVVDSEAPPCKPQELWFPEVSAGQEVACHKVRGPVLNAGDIARAVLQQERSGAWAVVLTLTDAGAARLAALSRDAGGQYAIMVDGQLVSVLRYGAAPPGHSLITGLDEQTAKRIADRLPR